MPTVNELGRKRIKRTEQTFTVDGKFLRDEARDAIRSYFMPFAGIYAAVVGKDVRVVTAEIQNPGLAIQKRAAARRLAKAAHADHSCRARQRDIQLIGFGRETSIAMRLPNKGKGRCRQVSPTACTAHCAECNRRPRIEANA